MESNCLVPMKWVGPMHIYFAQEKNWTPINIPLATYEYPLWPSVSRGAKISRLINGIRATVLNDNMTRSLLLSADSAAVAKRVVDDIQKDNLIQEIADGTSRFIKLNNWSVKIIGKNIYLHLSFYTANASGHNMVTKASDAIMSYLNKNYPVSYVSISGNYCIDKKVSALNSIMGRGKSITVEGILSEKVCNSYLRTTTKAIHNLNIQKNYLGSIASGSICSANAHYANILLASYIATGQDAANIVEGSQGITTTEILDSDETQELYFSVNLPNIIVGTVGNGKNLVDVFARLQRMGCVEQNSSAYTNSQKLAMIIAAAVWCSELSLLAAQTNAGELMKSHLYFERKKT